jgi:hypothetical protein
MGLFSKAKDAQKQAREAMTGVQGTGMSAGMPGMGGQDMAAMAAQAQMYNKLATAGVEAPGVINGMRPTGAPDLSGGTPHAFDVTITPAGGAPYATTIQQVMLPAQMEGLSDGQAVTVKYDPDNPMAALLHSW